ncbi:MAG: hypothetical protein R2726_16115 [Acidimicrobiales bacterium]
MARMRRRRAVTHGRADDGSAWLRASGPPDEIARIVAGLVPWAEATRRDARAAGEVLTEEQARFDGLVRSAAQPVPVDGSVPAGERVAGADVEGDGDGDGDDDADAAVSPAGCPPDRRRGRPRWATKVIVNVDLQALRRGFTVPGERCEISGLGPVPVAVVDDLLRREDTFVAAVLRDGGRRPAGGASRKRSHRRAAHRRWRPTTRPAASTAAPTRRR